MDKKEIYEHLAKIYLDASLTKKKIKKYSRFSKRNFAFLGLIFVFAFGAFFALTHFAPHKSLNSEIALVLSPDVVRINFNFDPARKETYSVNLNRLNLMKYKALGFSVKKSDYMDNLSLRIEFTNAFREKSEVYLKKIPNSWQEQRINFSNFKNISDWSEMTDISFIVEEWNAQDKRGFVYLENVRFIK